MTAPDIQPSLASALDYFDQAHAKFKEAAEEARLELAKAIQEYVNVDREEASGARRDELSGKVGLAQETLTQRLSALFDFEDDYREHWKDLWAGADESLRAALSTAWRKKEVPAGGA